MDVIGMIGVRPWLRFLWKGHIVNWLWRDKLKRRVTRNNAYGEYKMSYLERYADYAKKIKVENHADDIPWNKEEEKIYTLWFQGEENAPEIVKKCFESIKERYDKKLIILNDETLFDYISLPEHIMTKWREGKIGKANFSDIIRIELLYQFGGYWFDATDFLTDRIPEEISGYPFFMFVSSDVFFPHMFVQTCFIRARKKNPLLGMWRNLVHEYWRREDKSCEYFLVHMLLKLLVRENAEAQRLFEKMPKRVMEPTHILWTEFGNLPFDKSLYDDMKRDAFFQKCSYKPQKRGVGKIIPGSIADMVINGYKK